MLHEHASCIQNTNPSFDKKVGNTLHYWLYNPIQAGERSRGNAGNAVPSGLNTNGSRYTIYCAVNVRSNPLKLLTRNSEVSVVWKRWRKMIALIIFSPLMTFIINPRNISVLFVILCKVDNILIKNRVAYIVIFCVKKIVVVPGIIKDSFFMLSLIIWAPQYLQDDVVDLWLIFWSPLPHLLTRSME